MQPTNTPPNTPPNMQPRPGVTIRGRRFTLPWVIGGVVAVLVILSCGCCGTVTLASALNGGGNGAQATATTGQAGAQAQATHAPKATATTKSQPTATHAANGVQPIDTAVLGGTEVDFIRSGASETYNFKDSRTFQGRVGNYELVVGGMLTDGTGDQRFSTLILTPLDKTVTWDSATAYAIAKQLIPDDARYVTTKNIPDFGVEQVYVSKSLAASFPADAFTDADTGATVTPGTFYISCGNVTSQHGGCTLQLGQ